jgi:UDP-glucose 4-epimerase
MDYKGTYVSVIMKVLDKIDAGEQPIIFGDGSQAYDVVHVGDVARANILAMKSDATDVNLNVGTGIQTTIKELVDVLLEETGAEIEPEYRADEQMFVKNRVGATELAAELIGFRAELPYREGLRSVIEWRRSDQRRSLETAP